MNTQSQVKFSIYYMIRDIVENNVNVSISNSMEDVKFPSAIVSDPNFITEPLQLGGGAWLEATSHVDVFTEKFFKRDEIISDIMGRLVDQGLIMVDYSPYEIDGETVSNFPYEPADSDTENPNYDDSRIYGRMDFEDIETNTYIVDSIEDESINRGLISFVSKLVLE